MRRSKLVHSGLTLTHANDTIGVTVATLVDDDFAAIRLLLELSKDPELALVPRLELVTVQHEHLEFVEVGERIALAQLVRDGSGY